MGLQIMRSGEPTVAGIQLLWRDAVSPELDESTARAFIDKKPVEAPEGVLGYRGFPLDVAVKEKGGVVRRRRKQR